MSAARDALLELLRRDAYRAGMFTLASGRQSDFFIDCKQVMLTAWGHRLIGEALYERVTALDEALRPTAVAGVALGGCALASAVSMTSADKPLVLDALYVRKEAKDHGTRALIAGKLPPPASHIVLVEDVLTTGGSALSAVQKLVDAGFTVSAVLALVDRHEGGAEAIRARGMFVDALYSRADFVRGNSES